MEVRPNQVRAEPAAKTTMADKSKFDNLRVKMQKEISAAQLAKRKWNREMKLNEYTTYRTMVSILHLHVDGAHCGPWHCRILFWLCVFVPAVVKTVKWWIKFDSDPVYSDPVYFESDSLPTTLF